MILLYFCHFVSILTRNALANDLTSLMFFFINFHFFINKSVSRSLFSNIAKIRKKNNTNQQLFNFFLISNKYFLIPVHRSRAIRSVCADIISLARCQTCELAHKAAHTSSIGSVRTG